ncbi:helix-turn-helix domain-containing protein [Streptomyces pseudovenezuelae]|uniref:DUF2690 domain-containing protein n=1 Tax=Streptomyces pseudovenezuelae TaxID=67350 RepID=A0ABZ1X7X5_9ACTN|nr:DUF2690 domain-containing protein [Streptomyces pseudovenezuelae]
MTPGAPSPPGARLAAVLQQLRQRTGLSLAQLAHATTYSKSSWERYLNGKSLPPRSAVKELCLLADEPADRALALLDIARADRTEDGGAPPTAPVRRRTATGTDAPAAGSIPAPPETDRPDTAPSDTAPSETAPAETAPSDTVAADDLPAPIGPGETAPGDVDPTRALPTGHRRANIVTALLSTCAVVLGALVLTHLPPTHREAAAPPPTPTAANGTLCRRTACQNKDPIAMRCGAAPLTLAEHETTTGAWIQIRYSQECGASWARMWGAALRDRVEFRAGGRHGFLHSAQVTNRNEADTYVHTLMSVVSPGTPVQACFTPAAGGVPECFEARSTDGP